MIRLFGCAQSRHGGTGHGDTRGRRLLPFLLVLAEAYSLFRQQSCGQTHYTVESRSMSASLDCAGRRSEPAQKRSLAERRAVNGTAPHEALPTPSRRLVYHIAPQARSPLPS